MLENSLPTFVTKSYVLIVFNSHRSLNFLLLLCTFFVQIFWAYSSDLSFGTLLGSFEMIIYQCRYITDYDTQR